MPDSIFIHLPCYLNSKILYSYMVSDLEALGDHMTCVIDSLICLIIEKDLLRRFYIPK